MKDTSRFRKGNAMAVEQVSVEAKLQEQVKALLRVAGAEEEQKRAEKHAKSIIKDLLSMSRVGLIGLLPIVLRKYPPLVLKVLLQRIRNSQWKSLSQEDQCLVVTAENTLQNQAPTT